MRGESLLDVGVNHQLRNIQVQIVAVTENQLESWTSATYAQWHP